MITATELQKLLNAGFKVIEGKQYSISGLSIWAKTNVKREWHLLEKGFASKAALKRRVRELMKDPLTIDLYDTYHRL